MSKGKLMPQQYISVISAHQTDYSLQTMARKFSEVGLNVFKKTLWGQRATIN